MERAYDDPLTRAAEHRSSAPTSPCLAVFPVLNINVTDTLSPLSTPYTVLGPPGLGDGEPEMTAAPRTLIDSSPSEAGTAAVGASVALGGWLAAGAIDELERSGDSINDAEATPAATIAVPSRTNVGRPLPFVAGDWPKDPFGGAD